MATSLQTYKERYPQVYGNLSDVDTIYKMSELTGRDPQELAEHFDMYNPDQGDFARGMSSGVDSLQGGLYGLAGYVGDVVGSDKLRDFGYEGYEQNMKQVGLRAKDTDNIENAESVGDYVNAAQYWLGYAIPQIIEAVVVSKGAGAVTRKAAEQKIKSELKKEYGGKLNKGALNAVMSSNKTQAQLASVLPKAAKKGEYTGLAGQAIGTELGYTYGGAVDKALEEGKTKDDVDLLKVTGYGTAAGVAEFGAEALTLGLAKVGPAKNLFEKGRFTTKSRTANAASRGLGGGTLEAGTEMVQTGLEEMGAGESFDVNLFTDKTSAFAGFVGGSAMGTVGGALTKKTDPLAVIDETIEEAKVEVNDQQKKEDEEIKRKNEVAERDLAAETAEAERKEGLRKKHSRTFLSEEELLKENKEEQDLIDNLEIGDPETELGASFQQWQTENQRYETRNDKANEKLKQDFLKSLPKPSAEENTTAYLNLLDEHAALQETREKRDQDPEFNPEANAFALEEFYKLRQQAIQDGDLAALRKVESDAERTSQPGEWPAFKREAKFQEALAVEQAKANAKSGTGTATAAAVVTTPEETKTETQKPIIKTLDDIDLTLSPQQNQVWEFIKGTVADGTIGEYYKVEQTEGKGSSKAKGWATEKISKLLGLKSKGNVSQAITRIKKAVDTTYGQDFETILNSLVKEEPKLLIPEVTEAEAQIVSENNVTGAPIDESETPQGEPVNPNEILSNTGFNIRDSEGQSKIGAQKLIPTTNVPSKDPIKQKLDTLPPEERAKEEAKIDKANEAEAVLAAQQKEQEGSAKLDEQGQARRDEAHNKRIKDVQVVFKKENKEALDPIQQEWDNNTKDNDPKFNDMSLRNRSEWVLATAVALETGNDSGLQQTRQDIIQKHTGEQTNESKRGTKVKTKKVLKGASKGNTKKAKPRGQANTTRKNSSTKIRKPAEVVKPKEPKLIKKIKADLAYVATTRLGKDWETKHPQLTEFIKKSQFRKFQDEVVFLKKKEGLKTLSKADEVQFQENKAGIESMFLKLVGPKQYKKIQRRIFIGRDTKDLAFQTDSPESGKNGIDNAVAFVRNFNDGSEPTINFNVAAMLQKAKRKKFGANAFEAVFMHEVGSHIGLDRILSPREAQALAAKIRQWSKEYTKVIEAGKKPSMEQQAAHDTMKDMANLDLGGNLSDRKSLGRSTTRSSPDETATRELKETIAYFITYSVGAGATPSQKTDVGKVLNKFRQAFRKFMGYFVSETDNITGQDIIDMAYGAAALQLRESNTELASTKTFLEESRNLTEKQQATVGVETVFREKERAESRATRLESLKLAVEIETNPGAYLNKLDNFIKQNKDVQEALKKQDNDITSDLDTVVNIQEESFWDKKINEYVAKAFPKNDKNKYIAPRFLPLEEWKQFQIQKGREAKKLRASLKAEVKRRMDDAAKHEQRLYDPDQSTADIDYELSVPQKQESKGLNEKIRDWLIENMGVSAGRIWDTSTDLFVKGAESTQFLHQLIRKFEKAMPAAKAWHRAILKLERTRNDIKRQVDEIQVQARDMNSKDLVEAEAFIKESTEKQLWGYNPHKKSSPRHDKVTVDNIMAKKFNKLNKAQQKLAVDIFAHGDKMLIRKREIAKMFFGDERDPEFKKIGEKFFGVAGLEGPYAPLRRFGTHVVELKSQRYLDAEKAYAEDGGQETRKNLEKYKTSPIDYEVSFHGSMGMAKQYRDTRKNEFVFAEASPKKNVVSEGRSPDYKILDKVLAGMGVQGLDKTSTEYQQIELMIKNMYFESLSEENARRSQQKRMTVAGAELSMVKSFVSNATAEANLIANMEHGTSVNTALGQANQAAQKDRPKLQRMYNLIVSHYVSTLNEDPTPVQDRLAAINTVYMLTSSVGYHITNATQPIMVTIPKLVGDFGTTNYLKVFKLYYKGLRMAKDVVTFNTKNFKFQTSIDIEKAPLKYRPLLLELQERQLLDVGLEQDLANFNKSETGFKFINKGSEAASTIAHRLYQVARMVEAYNRISTATASFEMAKSKPQVANRLGMDATEYAISIVEDTQGNFSAMDAPQILKKAPKLMGQYRKYQIMMAWVYADATKKSLVGATPHEKAAGKRTMGFMMGHAALFSGAVGVPVIGQIAPYLMGMLNEGDEPEDLERWIKENIGDETWAKIIARGLPTVFGIDMSTKLSQQKIFHPAPYTDFEFSENAIKEGLFEVVLGPSAATISNFIKSIDYAREGNTWRATEYALPKGVRTLMESYRLSTEGYSLRNGIVAATPDAFSGFQLAVNALGIPSTDINNVKWTRGQQFELEDWFQKEQSKIRKRYLKAKDDKDRKEAREAINDWRELQNAKDRVRPFFNDAKSAIKRTALSSLLKAPSRAAKREKDYREQLGTD